jgi:hypothetical protein
MDARTDPDRITFAYRYLRSDGFWRDVECPVSITWTPCHYGGKRPWFVCPAQGCGRRVAILYLDGVFACRRCYQCVYESQRRAGWERALAKAQRIRMRLGGSGSVYEPFPLRPKRMHRTSYAKLRREEALARLYSYPTGLLRRVAPNLLKSRDSLNPMLRKETAKRGRAGD